jgi:arsenate reductase-like glutaredoxin family protein
MCICRPFLVDDVKLFAVPDSAETRQAEDYLRSKGIRYDRCDVSIDEAARVEVVQLTGQAVRPVVVIGEKVFVGFDEAELSRVVP